MKKNDVIFVFKLRTQEDHKKFLEFYKKFPIKNPSVCTTEDLLVYLRKYINKKK